MEKKLDHIGVAVRNIEDSIAFYTHILGGTLIDRYRNEAEGVESEIAIMDIHGDRTELLMPTNNTSSPIARFIKQKGKGVHHVAYHVGDLKEALKELEKEGIRTLEWSLRTNKHGRRLIYLNPADTGGTIIEYCDYPDE
ncbi:methylmalonyl-CoA epimerase [Halobacillus karajensis]|uniref:Lyase n=1 Tax=Halobacillus karajensis TaxID=195088 RepID=A0A024P945_9BACI|nr:VOC family protein [Halobacillus karajensis]CDQ21428.1 putative lyase [Halobacillus karajensis]CDQ25363.1 putative lyase [Halobacillus karajensis]CDQ29687.1 putative lyase [Halobacillus karajensis]SEI07504.1 methylmalonyl-CoA epimerase [Halobacillus karajensis]